MAATKARKKAAPSKTRAAKPAKGKAAAMAAKTKASTSKSDTPKPRKKKKTYELKTKKTDVSVDSFLDALDAGRREDCRTLVSMMRAVSGAEPRMWGPSIVGFGDYHYVYDSGHEGDMCEIGFAPRKGTLVLYISCDIEADLGSELARLGKHSTGRCCLYIKRLADVDLGVLRDMMEKSIRKTRKLA